MKFGKEIARREADFDEEWRPNFIAYKSLKKLLKELQEKPQEERSAFLSQLHQELDKVNEFYLDREEDFVIRSQFLEDLISRMLRKNVEHASPEAVMPLKKMVVDLLSELVSLEAFATVNFTGLNKILKKRYKKLGTAENALPLSPTLIYDQPFCTSSVLSELVNKCRSQYAMMNTLENAVDDSSVSIQDDSRTLNEISMGTA